ncbi:MAG: hypothetical protein Q4D05_03090 [Acinetobacter sp.]|nr:hypothetical protein [Acinetobacter sp.]
MTSLIHQGKFRERANRTSRYQQSENRQAQLDERNYAQSTHGELPSNQPSTTQNQSIIKHSTTE